MPQPRSETPKKAKHRAETPRPAKPEAEKRQMRQRSESAQQSEQAHFVQEAQEDRGVVTRKGAQSRYGRLTH